MDNRFVFKVSPIDNNILLEQIAYALEKRTAYISRATNPKLWEYTDILNKKEKVPESVLKKRRKFRKIVSVINLLLCIFLFIPGLMEPDELKIPLFIGGFAILLGLAVLLGGHFLHKNNFIKPAEKILKNQNSITSKENKIVFLENHMEIQAECKKNVSVPYSEFECIIETEDILLLTYQGKATILKKEDLQINTLQDFSEFLLPKEFYIPLNR